MVKLWYCCGSKGVAMNYLILSPKRSGLNITANWMAAHTSKKVYRNCCFGWEDKKLLTMKGKVEAKEGIVTIEDFDIENWYNYDFEKFPFLENCKVVILLRSLKNWLASCYKRKFQDNEEHKDVYKYLLKPYINDSKLQSPSRVDIYDRLLRFAKTSTTIQFVKFDDWFKEERYRKHIARRLDFDWKMIHDLSIKYVASDGKGSSFEHMKYNGRADEMPVLERWKEFKDDEEFQHIYETAHSKISKTMTELGMV